MSDVEFYESNISEQIRAANTPEKSKLTRFLESMTKALGVPKEYSDYAILGFVVIIVVFSLILFYSAASASPAKPRAATTLPKGYMVVNNRLIKINAAR